MRIRRTYRGGIALVVASVFLVFGAGCSNEAKKARFQKSGERHFAAEDFGKAEIEYRNLLRLDKTNRLAIKRLGQIYFQRGEISTAYRLLRAGAELDPNDSDVRVKLGTCYLLVGTNSLARAEAVRVLAKDTDSEDAFLLLADAATGPKEIQETFQQLEKLRPQAGGKAGFHLALGNLYLEQQDLKAAESALSQALRLNPKSSGAHAAMGRLRTLQGDLVQAEQSLKTAAELAPLRSSRRLKYAEFKMQGGDLAGARTMLEDLTKKASDFSPAWIRLAELAMAEGKLDSAEAYAGRVLSRDPRHYEAMLISARLKLAKNDRAKALAEFERAARAYPRIPQAHYELGVAQLANGELDKAEASLRQALALDPNHAGSIILLAELNTRKGDAASAITSLSELTKKQPRNVQAQLSLANAYRTQKNFEAALATYRRLAELSPKNPQPLFLAGLVLREQKKTAEARTALEKAAELAPDDLRIVEQLAGLDVEEKRFSEAVQRVQKLVNKHPKAAVAQVLLAEVHLAQGSTNQAEAALQRAVELEPDSTSAYFRLAQIYLTGGKHAQALEKLRAAAKKNPKDVPALMLMAMLEDKAGNHEAARDAYEKALAVNPQFGPALNNLAYLYSEHLGQPDKAYERATQARKVQPQDPNSADTLGWILFKRGEYARALPYLRESAEKLSSEPEVLFHLGMAQYMTGDEESARTTLQRALALKREFTGQDEAKLCLSILSMALGQGDDKAIRGLEERLGQRPGDPIALTRLVALYRQKGEEQKAIQACEKAWKANPSSATIALALAELYSRQPQGREKALEMAKQTRNLAPDDARVAYLLGRLAFQAGDYKWALSLLQESTRTPPANANVLYDLGLAYFALGRLGEAETALQDSLKLSPPAPLGDSARRFLAMSAVCRKPASAPEAASQVQQVLQANPDFAPALLAAATIQEAQGKLAEAKQTYEKLVNRYPLLAPAVRRLAILYADDASEAQKAFDLGSKAREMYPEDVEVARALGIAAYQRRDYMRSAQLLKEYVGKGAPNAECYFYLGMACHQLKRTPESKEFLNKAVSLSPNAKFAAQAKEVLAQLK